MEPVVQNHIEQATGIDIGTYLALQDGTVYGTIGFPANNPSALSLGRIEGRVKNRVLTATGGNSLGHFTTKNSKLVWSHFGVGNSFTLPVKKGDVWSVSVVYAEENEIHPPIHFLWVPNGRVGGKSFERIKDEEVFAPHTTIAIATATSDVDKSDQQNIDRLMQVLDGVFQHKLSPELGLHLRKALSDLVFHEIHKPGIG